MGILKPRVISKRTGECSGRQVIYIGRPSKWGNPFVIGKDGTRAEVIAKYKEWFLKQPSLVQQAKKELRGKDLMCYCAPEPCHGDTLLEIANVAE
jgi:hypothetical protein